MLRPVLRIPIQSWGQFLRIPTLGWGHLGLKGEKITFFLLNWQRERPFHQPSILLIHIDDTSELTILNEDPSSFPPSMAAGWSASFLVYVWAPKQASLFSAVQPEFVVVLLWSLDVGPGPRHSASWVSLGPPSRSNYDRKHRAMPLTHRYVGKMNISGVSQKASNSILKMPADSGPGNRIELG